MLRPLMSRARWTVLMLTALGACFSKTKVDVAKLRCAGDKNCPIGYECRDRQGSPPLGFCVAQGTPYTSDASTQADVSTPGGTGGAGGDAGTGRDTGMSTGGSGGARGDAGLAQGGASGTSDATVDAPLSVDLPAKPALAIVPSTTTFPATVVGSSSADTVFTVSNLGDSPTGELSTALIGADFAIGTDGCRGVPLPGRSSCQITVKLRATTPGNKSATLEVSANPGGKASATMQGDALTAGQLAIKPLSVTFQDTVVGSSSRTETLTISNSGDTTAGMATALEVALSGSDASAFAITTSTCKQGLPARGECLVTIAFSPRSSGTKTASLTATATPGGAAASSLSAVAIPACGMTSDGVCPANCTGGNDIDCRLDDQAFCSENSECKSNSCMFSTCCGLTWSCPECVKSAHCTTNRAKPVCSLGECVPCKSDTECLSETPVCDWSGACVPSTPLVWSPTGAAIAGKAVVGLGSSGNNLLASAMDAGIFFSADQGATWTLTTAGLESAAGAGANRSLLTTGGYVLLGTSFYGVFRSSDDGVTWKQRNVGLPDSFTPVWSLGVSGDYVLGGLPDKLARSRDYGDSWELIPSPENSEPSAFAVAGTTLYMGTNGAGVWTSTNNGTTWTESNAGLTHKQIASLYVSGTTILAGSVGGSVFYKSVSGTTWSESDAKTLRIGPGGATNVTTIAGDGSYLFATHASVGVILSTDGGRTWRIANRGLPAGSLVETVLINGRFIYVATYKNGVYRSALP